MKYKYSFAAYLVAFIIQSTLLHNISIFGVSPNLILILTIVFSFLFVENHGIIFGIIFGWFSDFLFSPIIGVGALSYFIVAMLIQYLKSYLYRDNFISALFISTLGTLVYNSLFWGISSVFGAEIGLVYTLQRLPILIIFNTLIAAPLYLLLIRKVIGYRGLKYM